MRFVRVDGLGCDGVHDGDKTNSINKNGWAAHPFTPAVRTMFAE